MSSDLFDELKSLGARGLAPAVDRLTRELAEQRQYHRLFDARMLQRKAELGLPLNRPSSLADVPDALRKQVEETYVAAAREAGENFLAAGDIPSAWMYLQVIREPQKVSAAIEQRPIPEEPDADTEQLIRIALFEGVHPQQGVRMMLRLHGTCSTITALDQSFASLKQEHRELCARVMVRELYDDLRGSVERDLQRQAPDLPANRSLRELLAIREDLLAGGGYHIDVSHLNAVVRFGRSIEAREELDLARQLAEYGAQLDPQLQYAGDPPFEDFYPAHVQFFCALLEPESDALDDFRAKLRDEPDPQDRPLLAYVLVDLLMRVGRLDEAVDIAAEHLTNLGDDVGFSFAELCQRAGRLDVLERVTREKQDPVGFLAAVLATQPQVQQPTR